MSPSFFLFNNRFVALRIKVLATCLSTIIQKELGFVEVFLLASKNVKTGQSHLGYLMSWYYTSLSGLWTYFFDNAIGITLGYIKELVRACSLIVGASCVYHMTKVIEFVTQNLFYLPTFLSAPLVWVLWINGAGCIQITIGLLCSAYNIKNAIYICL